MKLALVANSFPTLSETFIYNHAAGLEARGVDVTVVATTTENDAALFAQLGGLTFGGPVEHMLLSPRIGRTVRQAAGRLLSSSSRDYHLWEAAQERYGRTRRALRAWLIALPLARFDVIHFEYSGIAATYLDALPLLRPARIVVSCRGTAERIRPIADPARAVTLREVFAIVDRVHCVSDDMLRTCQAYGLDPAKAFVNRPAVDIARFSRRSPMIPRTTGPYRLISTGRLHWAKGLEFALLAMRTLVLRGHDMHHEIIGAGPEEERLRFAIHDLGLTSHVTMSGRRSLAEIQVALERSDIYVLSSVSEGVSNAALEAMAMGVPVVTTSAGGMSEAISDRVDGMLVPSRAPEAMADAIEALLADATLRADVGAAGRRRVEKAFSIDRQISTFMAEYEALMSSSRIPC